MRIYSRHARRRVRYALRCMRRWGHDLTREDWAAVFLAVSILLALVLWPAPAGAQDDPCTVCQEEHGVGACPCLPVAPEPPISEEHSPVHYRYLPLIIRGV